MTTQNQCTGLNISGGTAKTPPVGFIAAGPAQLTLERAVTDSDELEIRRSSSIIAKI